MAASCHGGNVIDQVGIGLIQVSLCVSASFQPSSSGRAKQVYHAFLWGDKIPNVWICVGFCACFL